MSMVATYVYEIYKHQKMHEVANVELRYFCLPRSRISDSNTAWLYMPAGRPDEMIDQFIDVSSVFDKKLAIMASHHSQRTDAAYLQELHGEGLKVECFYYAS